jgi:hypothetical protein
LPVKGRDVASRAQTLPISLSSPLGHHCRRRAGLPPPLAVVASQPPLASPRALAYPPEVPAAARCRQARWSGGRVAAVPSPGTVGATPTSNVGVNRALGEPGELPDPFLAEPATGSPEIGRSRRRPWPRGRIASLPVFLGAFLQSKGICVNLSIYLGTWL